ncbi:MAG: LPS-assembly protein LptD [Candidatus Competibacteraceae bacterium]|nr:LPS-assembly protein LptD [Candidatus Competibacteraceae bacterium]
MVHSIKADRIMFNQTLELLHAAGSVEYRVHGKDKDDLFAGESLVFDLQTLQGVFVDGSTFETRTIGSTESTFKFRGSLISRLPDDIVVMDKAEITSSEADPPNYYIAANRVWLLGGGEWGIQDATLHVGRIPVLYLPLFFYPGDEVAFHPVFGYDLRRGTFIQTTTYFLGNKPPNTDTLSTLQLAAVDTSDKVKEQRGLFLRATDRPLERQGLGDQGVARRLQQTRRLRGHRRLALGGRCRQEPELFVRTGVISNLYQQGALTYSPYYRLPDGTLESRWDSSYVGPVQVPLRYGLESTAELGVDWWNLKAAGALYSDPYLSQDFHARQEDQDWVEYLIGKPATPATISVRDSLTNSVNLTVTPVTSGLQPTWRRPRFRVFSSLSTTEAKTSPPPI